MIGVRGDRPRNAGARATEVQGMATVIVVCPGVHSPQLTASFLEAVVLDRAETVRTCIIPGDRQPVYSPLHGLSVLQHRLGAPWPHRQSCFLALVRGS
ncbi:MAG: hypothetical protein SNJ81_17630 [Cyanobacteriota bacterium]